jgi:hypothetical protein
MYSVSVDSLQPKIKLLEFCFSKGPSYEQLVPDIKYRPC